MASANFPQDVAQSVGRFWVANTDPDQASDGVCQVDGDRIEIEVAKPLLAWMEETKHAPGVSAFRPVAEVDDLLVHGALPVSPGKVSFVGARTVSRRTVTMPSGGGPELHRMRADWLIVGEHLASPAERFDGVRIRLSHLELWARTDGVSLSIEREPRTKLTYGYEDVDAIEAPFRVFGETDASLRLRSVATFSPPTVWGGHIETYNWLELSNLSGWTLDEALSRLVYPVQTLLTMLAGHGCEVTHLEVLHGNRWRPVFGHVVRRDALQPANDSLLLDRSAFTLSMVASWCELTQRLSPAPQVVAAAESGSFQTVDAEALALTTTAEGLDRALFPGSRRFTEEEVGQSVAAITQSSVPETVRNELVSALRLYFAEDSYPTRLLRLATAVAPIVPGCIGNPNRWKNGVRDLRVQLAHALERNGTATEGDVLGMAALVRSLRWVLTIRLLSEAGASQHLLAQAVPGSKRYQRDEAFWRAQLPRVFEAVDRP